MTTTELIATLKQGAPVSARLVREIIDQLAAFRWTRQTLQTVLDRYAHGKVTLTEQESGYVCEALAESEMLKEAVAWMLECDETELTRVSYSTISSVRRGMDACGSLTMIRRAARDEVDRLLEAK